MSAVLSRPFRVPRPYSLGLRLSWMFAGQTMLGLGIAGLCIYVVMSFNLENRAEADLVRKSALVRHLVGEAAPTADWPTMRHKLDEFFLAHEDLEVILEDASGQAIYRSPQRPSGPMTQARTIRFDLASNNAPQSPARAQLTQDQAGDDQLLDSLVLALIAATVLGAAAVSAAGFIMVRQSLAPLHSLADQMRELRAGQLGQRLSLGTRVDELQPWVDEFNDLLSRLEQAYQQLEAFNADVAHELRTPLATLIGQTEVELTRRRSESALRDVLGSNLEELHRLSSIIGDMLFLSRADNGARVAASPQASLAQEALKVLEFYEAPLAERGLSARVSGDALTTFDVGLVRRAISNLVSNGIRYALPGSEVVVAITQDDAASSIVVRNHGSELSASVLPRIFDRFFRAQTSREGSGGHHGLGLAIVKAIARMHGGRTLARCEGGITSIGFTIAGHGRLL